jgi:hypothetical protein
MMPRSKQRHCNASLFQNWYFRLNKLTPNLRTNKGNLGRLCGHKRRRKQIIVQQLDVLRGEINKLEILYQKKLINLNCLKKSLLQKAFSGELTEKDYAEVEEKSFEYLTHL